MPTDYSAKLREILKLFFSENLGFQDVADPMWWKSFGSALTQQMIEEAQKYIDEAVSRRRNDREIEGNPKMRIEEARPRKQAKIDSGEEFIIGVNSL